MNDEKYDYKKAIKNDIREYLENENYGFITQKMRDELYDELFNADSVTGNASGSYTFSTWKAESYLCHNVDLIEEVINEFGYEPSHELKGAEWWDVSIRCLLVGRLLDEVIDEWNEGKEEE